MKLINKIPDISTDTPTDISTKQLYKELGYCDIT